MTTVRFNALSPVDAWHLTWLFKFQKKIEKTKKSFKKDNNGEEKTVILWNGSTLMKGYARNVCEFHKMTLSLCWFFFSSRRALNSPRATATSEISLKILTKFCRDTYCTVLVYSGHTPCNSGHTCSMFCFEMILFPRYWRQICMTSHLTIAISAWYLPPMQQIVYKFYRWRRMCCSQ